MAKTRSYTTTITHVADPKMTEGMISDLVRQRMALPGEAFVITTIAPAPLKKNASRPERWQHACAALRKAYEDLEAAAGVFNETLEELKSVQEDYQSWFDNMPESLQQSATGEKLNQLTDLDLEMDAMSAVQEFESTLDEIENAELPLGFGRD